MMHPFQQRQSSVFRIGKFVSFFVSLYFRFVGMFALNGKNMRASFNLPFAEKQTNPQLHVSLSNKLLCLLDCATYKVHDLAIA